LETFPPVPKTRQKILMCAPDYFGVDYVINPWMEGNKGAVDRVRAVQQWTQLKNALAAYADLVFVAPEKGLPDEVFTANAGMVIGDRVIVSRFRSPERQGEEPVFQRWFEHNGFKIIPWPKDVFFEGAGDALFDREGSFIWCGHGFRSDAAAAKTLETILHRPVVSIRLVDPRFYHMDTCLCPLANGYLMYYPPAFDPESQQRIAARIAPEKRIVVPEEDALAFACNAVDLDGHVFLNQAGSVLQTKLRAGGFTPVITPLSEFLKAGGTAKCLTLKLIEN
jgi:N-dimethylarginine dimethylaminohydrolase